MGDEKRRWLINLLANLDDVSTKLVDASGVCVSPPSVHSTYAGRLQISATVFAQIASEFWICPAGSSDAVNFASILGSKTQKVRWGDKRVCVFVFGKVETLSVDTVSSSLKELLEQAKLRLGWAVFGAPTPNQSGARLCASLGRKITHHNTCILHMDRDSYIIMHGVQSHNFA
jgi:hypothetical protein